MDYIKEAHRTLSPQWHGSKINRAEFVTILRSCISNLQTLDVIKKTLFYGRDYKTVLGKTIEGLPFAINGFGTDSTETINVIHAIIGKATEAGELLEALLEGFKNEVPLDYVNLREEVGDGLWYDAILLKAIGSNFEEAQKINIDKLKARFPAKFTEEKALNRDLTKEREILEK